MALIRSLAAGAICATAALLSPAEAGDEPFGSVYSSYRFKTFLRGGVSFADLRTETAVTSPYGAIGGSKPIRHMGPLTISFEGEFFAQRQRFDLSNDVGFLTDYQRWAFAALFGARVDYEIATHVRPFASFGIGPAYFDPVPQIVSEAEEGENEAVLLQAIDDSIQVGYSGRAGVEVYLGEGFGVELGYRYFGASTNPTLGLHSAEFAVTRRF